jgi:hypothetical protein
VHFRSDVSALTPLSTGSLIEQDGSFRELLPGD